MAARLPGVYVTVEDRSYIEDQVDSGRSGLIVIMSDRGPENKVILVPSNAQFFMKYGKPEIDRTGQAHYIASQFLRRSNRLYVIRAALLDSKNPTHNCSLANAIIRFTPTLGGTEELINGKFILTACGLDHDEDGDGTIELGQQQPDGTPWDEDNAFSVFGNTFIASYVFCDYIGWDSVNVDDYIASSRDGSYESIRIIEKGRLTSQGTHEGSYVYWLKLEQHYTGRSTEDESGHLPITFTDAATAAIAVQNAIIDSGTSTPDEKTAAAAAITTIKTTLDSYRIHLYESIVNVDQSKTKYTWLSRFYFGPKLKEVRESTAPYDLIPAYKFTNGSNIVVCKSEYAFEILFQETWIMAGTDYFNNLANNTENISELRQIIEKVAIPQANGQSDIFHFILDAPYTGVTTSTWQGIDSEWDDIYTHTPIEVISLNKIKSEQDFNVNDVFNIFNFYAQGVGSWYNNIYMQGVRNYQLERMYTDEDGNILYKYMFMDLTVYGENADGSRTILEGPWTVSLINKVGNQVVRDLNTGRELYIVNTINERSNYIKCIEGINASVLEGLTPDKEELRLKVLALFSVSFVYRTKTRGQEGFRLENGGDGIQYDVFGRLNMYHPEIQSLIRNAYSTELLSTDGSIGLLMQTLYPWYILDYVMSGGYSVDIQSAARELVDIRNDCLLLADTGQYSRTAQEDLTARAIDVPWNTWNAMLYTQYRQITDPYTGKQLTISPVYHAIERHLTVDAKYFMSEPVAGIEKGAIQERAVLAYKPTLADMQEMIEVELNPVITEPDGTYILTQFTAYKRMSVMKRAHAVKIVQHLQKRLPSILKDILQRKGTPYWVNVARSRVDTFMRQFTNPNTPKHSFTNYKIDLFWDEERSEIYIGLTVHPLRAIEAIHVNIIVT
jgi:hypothetical protein